MLVSASTEPEVGALLVCDVEVVDAVHAQVLGDLEVLHLSFVPGHPPVVGVPYPDALPPHLWGHLVLAEEEGRAGGLLHYIPKTLGDE